MSLLSKMKNKSSKAGKGHYLSGKEVRAIAKSNKKIMLELEKKKHRKADESEVVSQMKDERNILEIEDLKKTLGALLGYLGIHVIKVCDVIDVFLTCQTLEHRVVIRYVSKLHLGFEGIVFDGDTVDQNITVLEGVNTEIGRASCRERVYACV